MQPYIPTEFLVRLAHATPEQFAAMERILDGEIPRFDAAASAEVSTPHRTLSPIEAERVVAGNVFRRAGSHWDVVFNGGEEFHSLDCAGARYVDFLLHRPGEAISAFDLEVAVLPEKAKARARDSIQAQLEPGTVRSYLRELTRLRVERERASEGVDLARTDQHDEEIAALEEALQASGRETGDAGERARNNVRKAVGSFIRRLNRGGKAERAFAAYLTKALSLGFEVMFQPFNGEGWA